MDRDGIVDSDKFRTSLNGCWNRTSYVGEYQVLLFEINLSSLRNGDAIHLSLLVTQIYFARVDSVYKYVRL